MVIFDMRLDERKRLLETANARKLWYHWTERGNLRQLLEALSDIVAKDLLREFVQVHRFADHITVLQRHFFLLSSSFVCSLDKARRYAVF